MRSRLALLLALATATSLLVVPAAGSSAQRLLFTATLVAPTHSPKVGQPWRYSIYIRDLRGRPIKGTAIQRVLTSSGRVVDGVGTYTFRGVYRRTYYWPRVDRGKNLTFQAKVSGPRGGTKTINYPIRVQ